MKDLIDIIREYNEFERKNIPSYSKCKLEKDISPEETFVVVFIISILLVLFCIFL